MVENSFFSPSRLTISTDPVNLPIIPTLSDEDHYDLSCILASAFVLPHFLARAALFPLLAPSWSCPVGSSQAHPAPPPSASPRSPHDCPICRLCCTLSSVVEPAPLPVRPWGEVKSRRGAPKRVNTEGFACPNRKCLYSGITDAHMHALVGDGTHGHAERIQTFRCQACRTTFTARRDTPLYRLKTPSQQVAMVLTALAEGLDASAAERIFGYRQATLATWLSRAGEHAQILHGRCFYNLQLPHLQLDELRTRLRSHKHVLWLWLAIDPSTRDSSRSPSRSTHAKRSAHGPSLPAATLGPRLPPTLHE
jgi:transposase-like protein